jgi:replicative DNA helicase
MEDIAEPEGPSTLPHSREAEEATIACVLINPKAFHEIRAALPKSGDEFYIHRVRFIWQACERLIAALKPIDILLVSEELDDMGRLDDIGGQAYLTALLNQAPNSLRAVYYADIVHSTYIRRQMLQAANGIAQDAYNSTQSIESITSQAIHSVSVIARYSTAAEIEDIRNVVAAVDADIEAARSNPIPPGIPTGLIDLDNTLGGGAQNSDLLLLAGRPGDGKTSALLQFARHAAKFRRNVAVISLEMPTKQLVMRFISQITGIDFQLLRAGRIPEDRLENADGKIGYLAAIEMLAGLPITLRGMKGATPEQVFSTLEIIRSRNGLDICFLDSLNLLKSTRRFSKLSDELDDNAKELKNYALYFDIPLWASHQMNRNIEKETRRPLLSDLREGGEQPADVVMFLYRPDKDEVNVKPALTLTELVVAKQRSGPTRTVPTLFDAACTRYENVSRRLP